MLNLERDNIVIQRSSEKNELSLEDLSPAIREVGQITLSRPSLSFWQDAWRRFRKNKQALFSGMMVSVLTLFVVIGPLFWSVDPTHQGTQVSIAPTLGDQAVVVGEDSDSSAVIVESHPAIPTENLDTLDPVSGLATKGILSTQKIQLTWSPVNGASGYSVYRSDVSPEPNSLGIPVGDTSAGNEVSFLDTNSLDSKTYYYSVVAKNLSGVEASAPASISVQVRPGLTVEQAKELGHAGNPGDLIRLQAAPLGTDSLGRDLLARIMYGGRISLFIGVFAAFLEVLIGIIIGGISGYYGGRVDNLIMRATDFVMGLPFLLFMILLKVAMGVGPGESGITALIVALVVLSWPGAARLVRGQILQLRESEFVSAARMMGAKPAYLLARHLIPNVMGNILVAVTFGIPSAIFAEAWLSFIGLGVASPAASWGSMSSEALQSILVHPHEFFLPSIFIGLTVLAYNLLGDGLRDALDPKMRSNE